MAQHQMFHNRSQHPVWVHHLPQTLRIQNTVTGSALGPASPCVSAHACLCLCACVPVRVRACARGRQGKLFLAHLAAGRKSQKHREQKAWAVGPQLRAEGLPFVHRPPSSGRAGQLESMETQEGTTLEFSRVLWVELWAPKYPQMLERKASYPRTYLP